jgi:5-methylcytosine-specific restriction endonuclease McrA
MRLSVIQRKLVEEKLGGMRNLISSIAELIRKSSQYKVWREFVFKRDDFTCQLCTERGGKLNADHIKQFALILLENDVKTFEDALNCAALWDTTNGRTLCEACHKKTPTFARKIYQTNLQSS